LATAIWFGAVRLEPTRRDRPAPLASGDGGKPTARWP